jgi:hypothetical protein
MAKEKYRTERSFASPSYDPSTGRAASNFNDGAPTTIEGERISPNRQLAKGVPGPGTPSWDEIDKARCTDWTPVNKRPLG